MKFVKTNGVTAAAQKLSMLIEDALAEGKAVTWFVSGGSAIAVALETQQLLRTTDHLTIAQIDERFGPVGHADSNWQQLMDAGFHTEGLHTAPILTGHDRATTTNNFEQLLHTLAEHKANTYIVALFGIGADGHTAGILPHSAAVEAQTFAAAYQGPDFSRITIAPPFFAHIDAAVVYAMGDNKLPALQQLQQDRPIAEQPAQLLKRIPDTWIFNDQLGEAV